MVDLNLLTLQKSKKPVTHSETIYILQDFPVFLGLTFLTTFYCLSVHPHWTAPNKSKSTAEQGGYIDAGISWTSTAKPD